jgi:hypothetical protein
MWINLPSVVITVKEGSLCRFVVLSWIPLLQAHFHYHATLSFCGVYWCVHVLSQVAVNPNSLWHCIHSIHRTFQQVCGQYSSVLALNWQACFWPQCTQFVSKELTNFCLLFDIISTTCKDYTTRFLAIWKEVNSSVRSFSYNIGLRSNAKCIFNFAFGDDSWWTTGNMHPNICMPKCHKYTHNYVWNIFYNVNNYRFDNYTHMWGLQWTNLI